MKKSEHYKVLTLNFQKTFKLSLVFFIVLVFNADGTKTKAATTNTTITTEDRYTKIELKFCTASDWIVSNNGYVTYSTVAEAKQGCNLDSECEAIYDKGCDESENDVYLCRVGATYAGSGSSCIYEKGIYCPWKNKSTAQYDIYKCNDGYSCNHEKEGWGCCNEHGGRELCSKNWPVMCNARTCAVTDKHPLGDYCCEKSAEECPQTLSNETQSGVQQCDLENESIHEEIYKCSWKYETTAQNDTWECFDGYSCNALVDPLGYQCCKYHGGLKLCPKNYPVMCNSTQCSNGNDYCCEAREYYCESKYNGITRPCEIIIDVNACPWKYKTTSHDDIVKCIDGYACNFKKDGYGCCHEHGGRELCPKNWPVMCSAKTCGITDENPSGDYCCEISINECQQKLTNPTNSSVRQCERDKEMTAEDYTCPWKYKTTDKNDTWGCLDGHLCNDLKDPVRFGCCKSHGGRKICPPNYPVMCNSLECANKTEYCCEKHEYYCQLKYNTTLRACEMDNRDSEVNWKQYVGISVACLIAIIVIVLAIRFRSSGAAFCHRVCRFRKTGNSNSNHTIHPLRGGAHRETAVVTISERIGHQNVTQQRSVNATISPTAIPGHDPPSYEAAMNRSWVYQNN